jgi:hypothetical protein
VIRGSAPKRGNNGVSLLQYDSIRLSFKQASSKPLEVHRNIILALRLIENGKAVCNDYLKSGTDFS